jgi:hypothetical protein
MEGLSVNVKQELHCANRHWRLSVGILCACCFICKMAGELKYPILYVMGTRCLTEREKYFIAINVTLTLKGFAVFKQLPSLTFPHILE